MLRLMRRAANTFVAKLLLLLLVGSFLVWGIADFIRERPDTVIASVGTEKVSVAEFQQTLTTDIQRLGRSTGQTFTMEQAQAFGLPARILARIMAEKTLDLDTQRFNLIISEPLMVQSMMADSQFFGQDNKFNRNYYEQVLRSIGLTEQQFLRQRTRQMQRQMLAESFLAGLSLPKVLNEALTASYTEERKIMALTIPLSSIPLPVMPAEDVLKAYYDSTKTNWQSPEYREAQLLSLSHAAFANSVNVSDDELKAVFEAKKETFRTPETRRILQIVFPDLKSAQEFEAGLKTKSFEKLAETRGEDPDSYDLGFLTSKDVGDAAVRAIAFALKKGEAQLIPNGKFGPVVIKVTDIEAEKTPNFETQKADIKGDLLKQKIDTQFQSIEKQVDDALANGEPLSDLAAKYKLTLTSIANVDRVGLTPQGTPVGDLKGKDDVTKAIFETTEGLEVQPLRMPNNDMLWVSVVKVTPAQQKSFVEVKTQVYQAWAGNAQFAALQKKAQDFADMGNKGSSLQELAKQEKSKTTEIGFFSRQNAPTQLTAAALDTIYRTKPKSFGVYFEDKSQATVVFQLVEAHVPDRVKDGLPKERETSLTGQYQDDIFGIYVHSRQNALGMHVNQALLNKVIATPSASPQ